MSKKSAKERKELKKQEEMYRDILADINKEVELTKQVHEIKFKPENYMPGKDFECRMKYQEIDEFFDKNRQIDMIKAKNELRKLAQTKESYEKELAYVLGELSARD